MQTGAALPSSHLQPPCRFNALDLATGAHRTGSPTAPVTATRTFPNSPLPNNATNFVAIKQLQRPGAAAAWRRPAATTAPGAGALSGGPSSAGRQVLCLTTWSHH